MNNEHIEVQYKGMLKGEKPQSCIVVIFGGSGDLSHKELLPAFFSLYCGKFLPDNYSIIGFANIKFNDESYREEMKGAVKNENCYNDENWKEFSSKLFYVTGDFNDEASGSYKNLKNKINDLRKKFNIDDNILFHLATPPDFYGTIIKRLKASELYRSESGWRRVIIEKPFGRDEKSARKLDLEIHEVFDEDQIFRVDHFLGKETVQNMLVFRFANPGFEPIWNRNYIDNVQITVAEDFGIETRGVFYERTGILRDMVQNHLLELLCICAIEPPVNYDARSLRIETTQVLDSIFQHTDIKSNCILGQYGSGKIDGKEILSYREEKNVDKNSMTPTFVAIKFYLDNWRWADVPFYLRTGKRMKMKLTEITIKFKPTPHLMFPIEKEKEKEHSILTFRLQPNEGILYTFTAKQPGAELKLRPVNLNFNYASAFGIKEQPNAYQWLILDAMKGDQTLFPESEWIYKAWNIVDPIIKKWEEEPWIEFPNYDAGTWGPKDSIDLIRNDGRKWNVL